MQQMSAFYNEIDPYSAQWLRNLIAAGHIANGVVDERSIEDIAPDELRQYTQCHFFAGIGCWSFALRLAGWPDDRPVWTGSCPCQPFSSAGKGNGFDDERHLWPALHHLISECRPPTVFGEQVASNNGLRWMELVYSDLEGSNYAVGAFDICAAGVGAPHVRQRLYWVADANGTGPFARNKTTETAGHRHSIVADGGRHTAISFNNPWRNCDWLLCRDNKWRPVEPGTFPLAHGPTSRVGRLRAYGNAIVPQVAQAFIEAYIAKDEKYGD